MVARFVRNSLMPAYLLISEKLERVFPNGRVEVFFSVLLRETERPEFTPEKTITSGLLRDGGRACFKGYLFCFLTFQKISHFPSLFLF